jgi:hypothetical protein
MANYVTVPIILVPENASRNSSSLCELEIWNHRGKTAVDYRKAGR